MSLRRLLGKIGPAGAPPAPPQPTSTGVGLFGKTPDKADFVRINAGGFSAAGLDRWLEEGIEALEGAGLELPGDGCDFLLDGGEGQPAVLGTLAPSRDKVGRRFPLTVFTYVEGGALGHRTAVIADADAGFLEAAHIRSAALRSGEAAGTLGDLAPPSSGAVVAAADRASLTLEGSPLGARLLELFPPGPDPEPDGSVGAVQMVIAACLSTGGRRPGRAAATLEVPAFRGQDVAFWGAIIQGALRWPSGHASWLWARSTARLLVALGPPCRELLLEWARPGRPGPRHWVVDPNLPSSRAGAVPPRIAAALADPATTVGALLAGLGAAPPAP